MVSKRKQAANKKVVTDEGDAQLERGANTTRQPNEPGTEPSTTAETPPGDQVNTVAQPPVEDPDRAPVEGDENIGFKEKRNARVARPDPNSEPRADDKVWDIASRARWGGSGATTKELMDDAKASEQSATDNRDKE